MCDWCLRSQTNLSHRVWCIRTCSRSKAFVEPSCDRAVANGNPSQQNENKHLSLTGNILLLTFAGPIGHAWWTLMALQPHRVASTRRLAAGMLTCFSVSWFFGVFFYTSFQGTVSALRRISRPCSCQNDQRQTKTLLLFLNAFTTSAPLLQRLSSSTTTHLHTRSPILMEWDG